MTTNKTRTTKLNNLIKQLNENNANNTYASDTLDSDKHTYGYVDCLVENVLVETIGLYYSPTILDLDDEFILVNVNGIRLYIVITEHFTSGNNECICWEMGRENECDYDVLADGYCVVDRELCIVVDSM